jgi:hypothetical protein
VRHALRLIALIALAATSVAAQDSPETPAASEKKAPTYHEDVAPIIQARCQMCHRPDAIGPFALMNYTDALGNSAMIDEVVRTRRMPPWHADEATTVHFSNSRVLPDAERQTILDWIDADCPAGDEANTPAPITYPDPKDFSFKPDAVYKTPVEFKVPPVGSIPYQYYLVGTHFDEDKWVTGWEVKVDAPSVVHHVLAFVVYPNRADSPRVRGGLNGYFCSMLPGESLEPFPLGSAKLLPKGASLRLQVHYTADGEPHTNVVHLALQFAKPGATPRRARTVALSTTRLRIPPYDANYKARARYTFRRDTLLMGLTPHMHVRGKSFNYLLIQPDGTKRHLLNVPRWDFNWQNTYRLKEPLFVPAGSKMLSVASYDNSKANRANPDPSRKVRFGEQTWDEMMIGYMDTVDALPEERAAWEKAQGKAKPAEAATQTKPTKQPAETATKKEKDKPKIRHFK